MDSKYLRPEFLQHLLAITIDDKVVDACVAGELKYEEQEPVTTGAGTLTMKRIHALVSIPESVRQNAQQQVEAAIRQNRADVLALSMGMGVVCGCNGSSGSQAGPQGSGNAILVSGPLILLLGIPLLTGAIWGSDRLCHRSIRVRSVNNGPIVVQVSEVPMESSSH